MTLSLIFVKSIDDDGEIFGSKCYIVATGCMNDDVGFVLFVWMGNGLLRLFEVFLVLLSKYPTTVSTKIAGFDYCHCHCSGK